ncbi:hypothetical protein KKC16_01425 [Patescibacteria group bacterium]|nr:hypothetical protein [Patescibacteria group bacterium]MBU4482095.1 hypothetical protein [Patescibacteria group bacterium]
MKIEKEFGNYYKKLGIKKFIKNFSVSPCVFTDKEINELKTTEELLIYLPKSLTVKQLCELFEIKSNLDFDNEKNFVNVMTKEDQWFITANSDIPELIHKSARQIEEIYNDYRSFFDCRKRTRNQ